MPHKVAVKIKWVNPSVSDLFCCDKNTLDQKRQRRSLFWFTTVAGRRSTIVKETWQPVAIAGSSESMSSTTDVREWTGRGKPTTCQSMTQWHASSSKAVPPQGSITPPTPLPPTVSPVRVHVFKHPSSTHGWVHGFCSIYPCDLIFSVTISPS